MAQNSGASSQPTPVELIVSISEMLLKVCLPLVLVPVHTALSALNGVSTLLQMHEVETSINTFDDVGNEVAVQQAL